MSTLDELFDRIKSLPQKELNKLLKETQSHPKWGGKRLWVPNPGGQTAALNSPADELFFGGSPGGGKLLALDTPLPTPSGWTTIGDIQVEDFLFDEKGKICRVVAKSSAEKERTYQMTFSDGSQIIAGARHQWITSTREDRVAALHLTDEWRAKRRASRPSRAKHNPQKPWVQTTVSRLNSERQYEYKQPLVPSVKTTEEIANSITHGKECRLNHSISVSASLQLLPAALLVDPYVLGVWLGDGTSKSGAITSVDEEVIARVAANGYTISQRSCLKNYGVIGLQTQLRQLQVFGNKHIPAAYLRASHEQRLALLQGLMDTDGTCNGCGQCEIQLTNKQLIADVHELICSLGIKSQIREGKAKLNGRVTSSKWRLKFVTDLPVFSLPRKLIRQKRKNFRGTHDVRYIVDCRQIESIPLQCIQVDSPSRMYLCGRTMIPTHNSALLVGTAICDHTHSIIFRKEYPQIKGLEQEAQKILGSRDGYNAQDHVWRIPGTQKAMEFGSVPNEWDVDRFQGRAHDLKGFDEICHFSRSKYKYLTIWLRSTDPTQRCRVICAGNPPQSAEGLWVIEYWAPWLDDNYYDPAPPGVLRWAVPASDDSEAEIFFHTVEEAIEHVKTLRNPPLDVNGNIIPPRSRTFIPGKLDENPDLIRSGYQAVLAYAPKGLQGLVRGKFEASLGDHPQQVIPTAWVQAAQQRWSERPPSRVPMVAMAADVAGGGADNNVISRRYDWWFDKLIVIPGKDAPLPSDVCSEIIRVRKDAAIIIIDCGGGYGGGVIDQLYTHNGIRAVKHMGVNLTRARSICGTYGFFNHRSEVWWRMREALDPEQPGGSPIALPLDTALKADLTAPRFEITTRGIKIEPKEELKSRLGRSPDRGDAVTMCWSDGQKAIEKAARGGNKALPQFAKRREGPLTRRFN